MRATRAANPPSLIEGILQLRLLLARGRKNLKETSPGNLPPVDLSPLVAYLEKTDKELEKIQDRVNQALMARARAGDGNAEMFKDALGQTRELLLDLLKMADDFED